MQPLLCIAFLLMAAGIWRLHRRHRRGLLLAAVAGLMLFSWPPFDWLLVRPLEGRYAVHPFPASATPQAIVVLASDDRAAQDEPSHELLGWENFERSEYAAWLYEQKRIPILLCGSGMAPLRQYLERRGVPASMIWSEEGSRNTYDSARYGSQMLRQHGVTQAALVVGAERMLRAEKCFRKQGIQIVPAPCHFREFGPWSDELLLSWKAIRNNEATLQEGFGLLWYWLRGFL